MKLVRPLALLLAFGLPVFACSSSPSVGTGVDDVDGGSGKNPFESDDLDASGAHDSARDAGHADAHADARAQDACKANCTGRSCGSDGCGGSCGTCMAGLHCSNANGECVEACTPDCTGKTCGSDGCGGSCGTCATGTCSAAGACQCQVDADCTNSQRCFHDTAGNRCVHTCDILNPTAGCSAGQACNDFLTDNDGHVFASCLTYGTGPEATHCTDSSACALGLVCVNYGSSVECSAACDATHACKGGQTCSPLGTTQIPTSSYSACDPPVAPCVPSCSGKTCGSDGCGGSCGTCAGNQVCSSQGACQAACVPNCAGKVCGSDGCGGSCGTCSFNQSCTAGGVCQTNACVPNCSFNSCGSDGCGGSCGSCPSGSACSGGTCVSGDSGCDPVTNTGCTAPEGCWILASSQTTCSVTGTGTQGSFCSATTTCAGGYACFASTCRKICDSVTGSGCGGSGQCVGVTGWTGYGACQ